MKKILFFILMLTAAAFAQEAEFSGKFSSLAGVGLFYTENPHKFISASSSFEGDMNLYSGNNRFYLNGTVTYDVLKSRFQGNILHFVSDDGDLEMKINEAWADFNYGIFSVRAGRQIVAWGKADGFQAVDILCPKDLTSIYASGYSENRIGIDALRFSYGGNIFSADVYWIGLFSPSVLPLSDKNPLKKVLIPENVKFTKDDIELPQINFINGEYAARVNAYLKSADISFYGFYGWDDMPVMQFSLKPDGLKMHGSYKRLAMAGADAAFPAGPFIFRFETAFFPQRYISTSYKVQLSGGESYVRRNELAALAGADWMPCGWTLSTQYYCISRFGDIDMTDEKQFQHQTSISVSRNFFRDTLKLSVYGLLGLNYFDSAAEISAQYSVSDDFSIHFGTKLFFSGTEKKFGLGKYEDLSCFTLKGIVTF